MGALILNMKIFAKNFTQRVREVVKKIPKGKTLTYAEVAKWAGNSKAYRAVGSALNKNPYAPQVPCHRVINTNGELGGFASGLKKKIKMLLQEGIIIKNNKVNLEQFGHKWR